MTHPPCMDYPALDTAAGFDREKLVELAGHHGLVFTDLACPGVRYDLRYASRRNFTGELLYPAALPCLLHHQTALKLNAAQQHLMHDGCGLLIWDAWRPPEAQVLLWNRVRDPSFVARPQPGKRWSWHCYGRAVDVAVVDGHSGALLQLPSDLDDFSPQGRANLEGRSADAARTLEKLQRAMEAAGFHLLDSEWWHFSDPITPPPEAPVWGAALGLTTLSL